MRPGVPVGRTHTIEHVVRVSETVPYVYPDSALRHGWPVLATGSVLFLVEQSCWTVLTPYLETGEIRLGRVVAIDHSSPAYPGDVVHVSVTPTKVSPRQNVSWDFRVTRDETPVATGQHKLKVIGASQFRAMRTAG